MDLRRRCERRSTSPRRHPLKADQSRQWRLLDLQAIDTRLDQITHARARLPYIATIAELRDRLAAIDTERVNARTAADDVQRELVKSDQDVQLVRDRAARNQARLDSGQGTAKELQALQHELQSLARRQSELEDVEIDVMERAERLTARVAELDAHRDGLVERLESHEAQLAEAFRELDAEAAQVAARRADVVAGVGPELVALYEKIRASSGGVGAAELRQRRCGGCRLELNNVDISRIRNAADDEVLRCEECRRIMIRTGESGL